jgi:hypothetical protein
MGQMEGRSQKRVLRIIQASGGSLNPSLNNAKVAHPLYVLQKIRVKVKVQSPFVVKHHYDSILVWTHWQLKKPKNTTCSRQFP